MLKKSDLLALLHLFTYITFTFTQTLPACPVDRIDKFEPIAYDRKHCLTPRTVGYGEYKQAVFNFTNKIIEGVDWRNGWPNPPNARYVLAIDLVNVNNSKVQTGGNNERFPAGVEADVSMEMECNIRGNIRIYRLSVTAIDQFGSILLRESGHDIYTSNAFESRVRVTPNPWTIWSQRLLRDGINYESLKKCDADSAILTIKTTALPENVMICMRYVAEVFPLVNFGVTMAGKNPSRSTERLATYIDTAVKRLIHEMWPNFDEWRRQLHIRIEKYMNCGAQSEFSEHNDVWLKLMNGRWDSISVKVVNETLSTDNNCNPKVLPLSPINQNKLLGNNLISQELLSTVSDVKKNLHIRFRNDYAIKCSEMDDDTTLIDFVLLSQILKNTAMKEDVANAVVCAYVDYLTAEKDRAPSSQYKDKCVVTHDACCGSDDYY